MTFCPNCGSRVTGRFCPNCGSDIGVGASPGYVPPAPIGAAGLTDNVASALCYLLWFVTGIVFLVLPPYNQNRTIRFHAWQSIFTFAAVVAIEIIADMLFSILHLWTIGGFLSTLFRLAVFIGWLYLMYSAFNRRKILLPVVGPLAEKQK